MLGRLFSPSFLGRHSQLVDRTISTPFGPATVVFDVQGVPTIESDDPRGLFFAQGFITAEQRWFQMNLTAAAGRGELAQVFGNRDLPGYAVGSEEGPVKMLDWDKLCRGVGVLRGAQASEQLMSDEARSYLGAYVQGVRVFGSANPKIVELLLLRWKPPVWSLVDSLLMLQMVAFQLTFSWRATLFGGLVHLGRAQHARALLGRHFTALDGDVDRQAYRALCRQGLALGDALGRSEPLASHPGAGSNGWAVAGGDAGGAVLANDTHLSLGAPPLWHRVVLRSDAFCLSGFAVPGLPGIAVGTNRTIAWGITAGLVQDLDLYLECFGDGAHTSVRGTAGDEIATHAIEEFQVKKQGTHRVKTVATERGQVLSLRGRWGLSCRWAGATGGTTVDGLVNAWRAESFDEFRNALSGHGSPPLHFVYGDKSGHVGQTLAGNIPRRALEAPLRPLEAWQGRWQWRGVLGPDEKPFRKDPKEGFVVAANHKPEFFDAGDGRSSGTAGFDPPALEWGIVFEPNYRAMRIAQVLQAQTPNKAAAAVSQELQLDCYAPWLIDLRQSLQRRSVSLTDEPRWGDLWGDFERWDGQTSVDSPIAPVAYAFALRLRLHVLSHLFDPQLAQRFVELGSWGMHRFCRLLEGPCLAADALGSLCSAAWEQACEDIARRLGANKARWRWGLLHRAGLAHPMGGNRLTRWMNLGPVEVGGGPDSVSRADFLPSGDFDVDVGAGMRMVLSVGDEAFHAILAGGQSGDPMSRHYRDQVKRWAKGELFSQLS